jgi:ATP-dependent RNA helicase DDX27
MEQAERDARRAENLIKYKDDIMSRPKKHWIMNSKDKQDLKKKSKDDIKNINKRFDEQISKQHKNERKRDKKHKAKVETQEEKQ